MMFIIRCCIFSFTWIVRNSMMLLNYMIKLMLVNTHMLIDCDIVDELGLDIGRLGSMFG